MPITKKAKAEAIERDYRINKRPDISDETTITWAELGALQARITELESFLCLGEQLDHLLECYGESDEPMTKGAEAIRDWMQEHVIKPKQRIAELEKELRIYDEAIRDCAIDRSLGGNRPVSEYIADARKNLSAPPEEAK